MTPNENIAHYQSAFSSLRPDRSSGHRKPHKSCLLLAVIDLIQQGVINDNKIYFDERLKSCFSVYFDQFKHGNDKDDPSQPFFYLESSAFWHHQPKQDAREEYHKRITDRSSGSPNIVSRIIDYAYVDEELFAILQRPILANMLRESLLENIDNLKLRFERWALGIGKSEKTVKNYMGALSGSISTWLKESGTDTSNIFDCNNYDLYNQIADSAKHLDIFRVRDQKGKGMYSAALKLYGEFLSDTTQCQIAEDIDSINQDQQLEQTEKQILVNSRIGQGQFRQGLIQYWGACAISGFKDQRLLIASHIKPWRAADNRERLDTYNGILLLPNFDKAFDLGLLSFHNNGKIIISEQIEDQSPLGIKKSMSIALHTEHLDYMEYHRDVVLKH